MRSLPVDGSAVTRGLREHTDRGRAEAPPPPPETALRGVLFDTNGTTPLEGISYAIAEVGVGLVASGTTDAEGRYGAEVAPGRYAVVAVGVKDARYLGTPGDTADVVQNQTTTRNLNVRTGYHLEILNINQDVQASAGANVAVTLQFRVWNRDMCPGCNPSVAIGVDGTPLAVARFSVPGTHPGTTYTEVLNFPGARPGRHPERDAVRGSTAVSVQPALDAYAAATTNGQSGIRYVPFGQLQVN